MDAIRSVADGGIEKVESIILQKKALLKNCKDVHESDRLFAQLDGLEWLQRQIAVYTLVEDKEEGANQKIWYPIIRHSSLTNHPLITCAANALQNQLTIMY